MRMVTSFVGKNHEFRTWLRKGATRRLVGGLVGELVAAVESGKVVSLADYRIKRKAASKRAALKKMFDPSIA